MAKAPAPSSSTAGFFQESPKVQNQFYEDAAFQRAFNLFLPESVRSAVTHDLSAFGDRVVSPDILRWVADAERNPPSVQAFDTWGRRRDELHTSEGWRRLQATGIREGVVAIGHERDFGACSRLVQFFKYHVWTGSSAMVVCPSAMQDGAASLITRVLRGSEGDLSRQTSEALDSALKRLTSREPGYAWTSAQWMTERAGGSDVRNTETRATFVPDAPSTVPNVSSDGLPLGSWRIDGFKWFSSATDADMTVLLAKTGTSDDISAFFAPLRIRRSTQGGQAAFEYNGMQLQRLKNKLGTKALPTAELVLSGMRAHLIGKIGQGTKELSTVLNVTRVHNAVGAMGYWGRGLAVSRAFSRVRKTGGKLLMDVPAHVKGLAQQHVKYRAFMLFTFFVVALLGKVEDDALRSTGGGAEHPSSTLLSSPSESSRLLRLLTPVLKATTARGSIDGLRFSIESLGGVGYLENEDPELNVARLYRDANVLAIWEGTTDVMAADMVRVLKGKDGALVFGAFAAWAKAPYMRWLRFGDTLNTISRSVSTQISALEDKVRSSSTSELLYRGQEIMESIVYVVTCVLLVEDSLRGGDPSAHEICKRWASGRRANVVFAGSGDLPWHKAAEQDRNIVFQDDGPSVNKKQPASRL